MTGRRLRVLLLTPYSPLNEHDHAAQDIARSLVTSLAAEVDLHVYAVDGSVEGPVELAPGVAVTMHAASPPTPVRPWRRLAPYPFRLRLTWQRGHTRDVIRLIDQIAPDVLHSEYLQPAEAMLRGSAVRRTATLHDITERVVREEARREPSVIRSWYHRWEHLTVARVERRLTARVDHAFVFSDRDRTIIASRGVPTTRVNLGVSVGEARWQGEHSRTLLFAGAMWRTPNVLAASFLADEVMPLVWSEAPDVRLRIVGSEPTAQVVALGTQHERVDVIGRVEDLDAEYTSAYLNLAPSMVEAGVLLKSLRSFALGCPALLNSHSAAPIDGLSGGVQAVVADTAPHMAREILALLSDPARAAALGTAARSLVRERYSWPAYVAEHVDVWTRLARPPA